MQVYSALIYLSHFLPINCGRHFWTPSVTDNSLWERSVIRLRVKQGIRTLSFVIWRSSESKDQLARQSPTDLDR